ncbi:MAG: response regulator transcription factor [Chloroflexi bacterium]|nr:response regulator transcription factor [Chloroflexota bacterium]
MEDIRILVVDDHQVVREGIRLVLESQADMHVVGEAGNGREALTKVGQLQPDVVLLDLAMPGISGIEAARLIRTQYPRVHILILTMQEGEEYFFKALEAGASGYLLKGASAADVVAGVRAVCSGGVALGPVVAKKLVSDFLERAGTAAASYDGLSPREREVLTLVAQGKTNQEIAAALFLSVNTVQTHRAHIMEKLDLHNRTELIKYAMRKGLIASDA